MAPIHSYMQGHDGSDSRAAIERLGILGHAGDPALNALVRVASHLAGGGAAAIHVLDDVEQHRIAAVDAPLGAHPREDSMCRLVVDHERRIVCADAALDPRFGYTSFVRGSSPVRFYISLPLRLSDGSVIGTLCAWDTVARDLGEEHVARLEDLAGEVAARMELTRVATDMVEVSRLKSQFLANTSHEIRTPLNGIIGMADLLARTPLEPEQREYAQTICAAGHALLKVINDVLDFSKAEAGGVELEAEDFDLHELVTDACRMVRPAARAKGVSVRHQSSVGVPRMVTGDRQRLSQVLGNLLANAVKFTECGSVDLRVEAVGANGDQVLLAFEVRDTGIGIPTDRLDSIFESFTQADASTTRRYGGTGLGLAIARTLAELMGGRIDVESEVGRGSRFTMTVPLTPASRAPARPVGSDASEGASNCSKGPSPARVAKQRVLLAEDNPINQLVACALLEQQGIEFAIAEDGAAAVLQLQAANFDLVLMDCQMPGLDGYEATRAIRAGEAPGVRTPIIAMTANAMEGDRERCLEAGMDDYLTKPVTLGELQGVLSRWIPSL